jgi:hypothetical protein
VFKVDVTMDGARVDKVGLTLMKNSGPRRIPLMAIRNTSSRVTALPQDGRER